MASTATRAASPVPLYVRHPQRVVLIGNPNTGKTTLFNALCGARAKTSNFPGTTTSTRSGQAQLAPAQSIDVLDIPGIYELHLDTAESHIARQVLEERSKVGAAVVIVGGSSGRSEGTEAGAVVIGGGPSGWRA